jgi:hypothetical protein
VIRKYSSDRFQLIRSLVKKNPITTYPATEAP